jgi:hypothetical protein
VCVCGGQSAQGAMLFTPGVAGEILCDACCSPVGLPNVSQAGLELTSCGAGALLFSHYNVVGRSFPWAMGSGC